MQNLSSVESAQKVGLFLENLKKGVKKTDCFIEFFELTLQEPIYEKLKCAYIQTANKKEGILYEAVSNRFFYIKADKNNTPSLSSLTKSVGALFPKAVKDKMFWVCGNKKDKQLRIEDFGESFTLTKPTQLGKQ